MSIDDSGLRLRGAVTLAGVFAVVSLCGCPWIDDIIGETTSANADGPEGGEAEGGGSEVTYAEPCPDAAPVPASVVCDPARQVAQVSGPGPCPSAPAGWALDPLSTPAQGETRCVYTSAAAPDVEAFKTAITNAGGKSAPDCRVGPVASPAGPPASRLGDAVAPVLIDSFARAIGLPDVATVQTLIPSGTAPRVAVYLVDTAGPDRVQARARHAPIVAGIIEGVTEGADAAIVVRSVAGLPRWKNPAGAIVEDRQAGGHFGYQSDLARGITEAVDTWAQKDPGTKLVINLSVGWEPLVPGVAGQGSSVNGPFTPAVSAVHDAIAYARCRGAVVIAASGNQPSGTCVGSTMGPALWAAAEVPDPKACLALVGKRGQDVPIALGMGGQPLVYAATPLDLNDRPLMSHRPGSHSWIAATGFQALVADTRRDGPQSGSSVASAVVSGTVALGWALDTNRTGDAVVQAMYGAGRPSPHAPDLAPAGPSQSVFSGGQRAVDVCATLDSLTQNPLNCRPASFDEAPWCTQLSAAVSPLVDAGCARHEAAEGKDYACESCDDPLTRYLPREEPERPMEALPDPWTFPQPEDMPCPPCGMYLSSPGSADGGRAELTLNPSFSDYSVQSVVLTLVDGDGARTQHPYWGSDFTPDLDDGQLHVVTDGTYGKDTVTAWIDVAFLDLATGASFSAGNQMRVYR